MVCWEQAEAAELDEMWSFAQNKGCQRRLWLAIDRKSKTRAVLAYVFGHRQDKAFRELKALLEPFGISISTRTTGVATSVTSMPAGTLWARSTPKR